MKKFFYLLVLSIVIFLVSCQAQPHVNPYVNNGDETIVEFMDWKITKSQLYDMMMKKGGISSLLDYIDRDLLQNYKDKIDNEEFNKEFQLAKDIQKDKFYINLVKLGILSSENDENREQLAKDYYLLKHLEKAYAKEIALTEITEKEITDSINNYIENYCIIPLRYKTKAQADEVLARLASLSETEVLDDFDLEWRIQNPKRVNPQIPDFLQGSFTCNYELADTNELLYELRNYIYNESEFGVGEYNEQPKLIYDEYFIIYKLSKAPAKENYPQTLFREYHIENILNLKLTDYYIANKVTELRKNHGLKIYDESLAGYYKAYDDGFTFSTNEKLKDKTIVAQFTNNQNQLVSITAEKLYDLMKPRYGLQLTLDKINYLSLSTIKDIELTTIQNNTYVSQVKKLRDEYFNNGYNEYTPWIDYLIQSYGAFSDEELVERLVSNELTKRYVLGYNEYEGTNEIDEEVINNAITNWFSIKASQIFISYDEDNMESKTLAYKMINQILNGCNNVNDESCYIYYNREPFVGLNNSEISEINTIFSALASIYSDDSDSKNMGGNLGYIGLYDKDDEFESRLKAQAELGEGTYTLVPVETEIMLGSDIVKGYQIILITDIGTKTPKPANYDNIQNPVTHKDPAVREYYAFITSLKTKLEKQHTSIDNYAKYLAVLRDTLNFRYNDAQLLAQYEIIKEDQLAFNLE